MSDNNAIVAVVVALLGCVTILGTHCIDRPSTPDAVMELWCPDPATVDRSFRSCLAESRAGSDTCMRFAKEAACRSVCVANCDCATPSLTRVTLDDAKQFTVDAGTP